MAIFAGDELGCGDDLAEVTEVGFGAVDGGRVECRGELGEGFFAIFAVNDDLGDHRVVERGDGAAGFDPCLDAGDLGGGKVTSVSLPGVGWKLLAGSFGVDAGFDGSTVGLNVKAGERGHLVGGLQNHPLDEVDAGDPLR